MGTFVIALPLGEKPLTLNEKFQNRDEHRRKP